MRDRTPRKLLLIINRLAPVGGAEIQLFHLAKGLAQNGHEVTICCVDSCAFEPAALQSAGIALVELNIKSRLGRAAAVPRLARLARQADVVHCTMWDPSLWGRLAAILARRPVIIADHATDRSVQIAASGVSRGPWISLHNRLLDPFTFATVACATSQRPLLLSEGVSPEKIVHIPNGVPIVELRRAAVNGAGRGELGLSEDDVVAIQVGLFRAEKNQVGALEAFVRVREEIGDAHLVFVGDGPLREIVEARAAALDAGAWAHFLGNRSDVAGLISLADLMLLPSVSDAMPMTVLESMALGVPVLATDVGDVRQMVGNGGVCVPAANPRAFSEQTVRLLSDPKLRARLAQAGLDRAPTFDSAVMVRRYEALFDAARDGKSPIAAVAAA